MTIALVKASPVNLWGNIDAGRLAELGVPLVVAGGAFDPEFGGHLELAARLGFSGVCLGRNIFQATPEQRSAVWDRVRQLSWSSVPVGA